jgi:hypothetical protein
MKETPMKKLLMVIAAMLVVETTSAHRTETTYTFTPDEFTGIWLIRRTTPSNAHLRNCEEISLGAGRQPIGNCLAVFMITNDGNDYSLRLSKSVTKAEGWKPVTLRPLPSADDPWLLAGTIELHAADEKHDHLVCVIPAVINGYRIPRVLIETRTSSDDVTELAQCLQIEHIRAETEGDVVAEPDAGSGMNENAMLLHQGAVHLLGRHPRIELQ